MPRGVAKFEDEVQMNLGVIAGNLMRREIAECLNCPYDECDGCPVLSRKKKYKEVKNVISKRK